MRLEVSITAASLRIRKGPSTSTATVGYLSKGAVVHVIKEQSGFYYLSDARGWIGKSYTKLIKNLESSQTTNKTNTTTPTITTTEAENTAKSGGLDKKIIEMLYAQVKDRTDKMSASTRLFGSPHQFTQETDFRLGEDEYGLGRKYMEAMITEAPIVYFLPGKPSYLPDASEKERSALSAFLLSNKDNDNSNIIDNIIKGKDEKYFSFLTDYATYMRYVNLLCRFCSVYLGIGDKIAPKSNQSYKYYDWSNYRFENTYVQKDEKNKSMFDLSQMKTDAYEALFGNYQYTQFFVEPNTSFVESTSNNTTQSKLEGFFDSAEGIVKELAFLMDSAAISSQGKAMTTFASGIDTIADKLKGSNENFFSRLLGMSSTVLSGSNVIFPQIWGDAAYNKSYNINIDLLSPYGDKEAIYLNILVPLMHLLALALPRQTSANSYASPFLIKAFAKGWFSCEMGIIDSITIEKGGQGSWSVDGLPTQIRVQVGVKDLYSNLMITPNSRPDLFIQNTGMIEFLAVTCGVDITKPQFATKLEAIFAMLFNTVTDIPSNLYRDFMQKIRNSVEGLYRL